MHPSECKPAPVIFAPLRVQICTLQKCFCDCKHVYIWGSNVHPYQKRCKFAPQRCSYCDNLGCKLEPLFHSVCQQDNSHFHLIFGSNFFQFAEIVTFQSSKLSSRTTQTDNVKLDSPMLNQHFKGPVRYHIFQTLYSNFYPAESYIFNLLNQA